MPFRWLWLLFVFVGGFVVSSSTGCERSTPTAGSDAAPTPNDCTPSCGGVGCDDGCGGVCPCPGGDACEAGKCVPTACGVSCRENERCVAGACVCEPDCAEGRAEDGCGASCPCPSGQARGAAGSCEPLPECQDTCAGVACGTVCGQDCGRCAAGTECRDHVCVCEPRCDGTRCDDGCGGLCECAEGTLCNAQGACVAPEACTDTCDTEDLDCGGVCAELCGLCGDTQSCLGGACAPAVSCAGCFLSVGLLEREVKAGYLQRVKLAVDLALPEDASGPRLVDLRLTANRGARLTSATEGVALTRAGKRLYTDPTSGKPWRVRPDGSYQFLVHGLTGAKTLAGGRLMTLEFTMNTLGPVDFRLERREQTFAPAEPDAALQITPYDTAVSVTR